MIEKLKRLKKNWTYNRTEAKKVKELEERTGLKIMVALRPRSIRADLWWSVGIAILWLPTLTLPQIPTANRFGIGCLLFYIVVTASNRYREAKAASRLGELVLRYQREHELTILDQVTAGDETLITSVSAKPGKDGRWRSVAWLEGDTTTLLLREPSDGTR